MKYLVRTFCLLGLILSIGLLVDAALTDPVTIPDANLRAAIETALSKTSGATITEAEMDSTSLTGLSITTAVSNLEGLQYAKKLTSITLKPGGYQNFNNLSPLRNLPLTRLFIRFNLWISDFSVLGDLPKTFDALTLQLTNLSESDLESFLPHLTGLGLLSIRQSNISDLSVLNNFTGKLYQLDVRNLGPMGNGWALRDLEPLVAFAKTKMKDAPHRSAPRFEVSNNYRLNYDSIYKHLPEIIRSLKKIDIDTTVAGDTAASFQYHKQPVPTLEHVSPETVTVYAGETHTHTVLGVNAIGGQQNRQFEGVPVEWSVNGGAKTRVPTGSDGLSSFTFTPRNPGEYTIKAILPENTHAAAEELSHSKFELEFTTTAIAPPIITLELYCESVTQTSLQWIAEVSGRLPEAYVHYYKKSADRNWIEVGNLRRGARLFSFTHFELQPGTSYDFQLFALKNGRRFGSGSNVLTARTLSPGAGPACPTPVVPPVEPPVETPDKPDPDDPPVQPPVDPPIDPPVAPPVQPPVAPPAKPPVETPDKPDPDDPPVQPPVDPPIDPPVAPPVQPPVAPPAKPPVAPSTDYPYHSFRVPVPLATRCFIFNEIYNATDDTNNWIELKNLCNSPLDLFEWEIRLITSEGAEAGVESVIVQFPNFVLPARGLLLVTNTDPGETRLAGGLNIATSARQKGAQHLYFVAERLKLPTAPFLLILQRTASVDGTPPATIEDVAGNYFQRASYYNTEVHPIVNASRPMSAAPLTEFGAWQRQRLEYPGYSAEAWVSSGYHAHLGYDRHAPAWACLGTPGYRLNPSPSQPVVDRLVFNKIHNTADDTNDYIELKNVCGEGVRLTDWEISIVKSGGAEANQDVDIVSFPDQRVSTGGVFLITNTELPNTPFLLILRYARDKNGTPDAIEDVAGNYFRSSSTVYGGTDVWPLANARRPREPAPLTEVSTWQRSDVRLPGYSAAAWTVSESQSPTRENEENAPAASPTVTLSISEIMFETQIRKRPLPQWIELYNPSFIDSVNLKDYQLVVETRQEGKHHHLVMTLEAFDVLPNQTALLTTVSSAANSGHFPRNRIYNLSQRQPETFLSPPLPRYRLLTSEGFLIQLTDATGNVVDTIGNLDGQPHTKDTPTWTLPPGETSDGTRASLRRLYIDGLPLDGTHIKAWVSSADVPPKIITYYGYPSDLGNPMYRKGTSLPVTLSSFKAEHTPDGVIINWTTESEVNNAGFYIYRSQTKAGKFQRVNTELIQGAGTTGERTEYTWTDTTAKANTVYYYQIEDVSYAGVHQTLTTTRLHGLISATGKMITQWADLK